MYHEMTPSARYVVCYPVAYEGHCVTFYDTLEELEETWDLYANEDGVFVAQIMQRTWTPMGELK